ncbi:MAG: hypothetical protein MI724_09410, partial [Spirochaetales bacterium]|nr:hypothetical protein [Spirochaetales bacterium]
VDRLVAKAGIRRRLTDSVELAFDLAEGRVDLLEMAGDSTLDQRKTLRFSEHFACIDCNLGYPELEPPAFSFNSPQGACPACTGLGFTQRFDPESVRRRLSAIEDELRSIGITVREEDREEAVEYRGEYYRIKDFVEDHLSLIWIGDFQNLSDDENQETDLFFYGEDDDYAYSERFPVRRVSSYSLEVDGQPFHLETQKVRRTVEEKISITTADREAMRSRLEELRSEIGDVLGRIEEVRRDDNDEAIRHLFVHRSYAEILETGMHEAERTFSLLDADIVELIAGLE